ncbi:PdaC/SigV domain-containing protein [Clostridium saccharobutylicum]|uniref:Putative lipoprotein n=1 Tax=Clostridium saccharobutylicum DSM 13864 TaxID=1345695 RepID=U5MXE8_CLOSA|nr:DUF4163 domain-containing protein [Clostridium saccharobutylicum]AGX44301.1 putative lipoprotein [Clostridium saccharobutylicum DSM 13864]AQR91592.1 hypothetical protein CLOSC_33180 [Clostridium saccharobutylicum]AQS01497.1 hypothetical protein CSACC_33260 [Clostridium saccharobutylicum]AQS11104.1 hypothetical protein CLOBY_32580 [Clostridium saccharobutylicum]AQS15480.1 hypothetical protein CLOSACC_33260 [Clostridium saccharobutylicum]
MNAKLVVILMLITFNTVTVLGGCNNSYNKNSTQNSTTTSSAVDIKEDNLSDKAFKTSSDADNPDTKEYSSANSINKSNIYQITNKAYKKNDVKINYPQLQNSDNSKKLNTINKDLEDEALNILNTYIQEGANIDKLTIDVNYDIKLKNDKYMSIVYTGYSNLEGTAYPLSVFYTTNVDLEKGNSIRLSDYADIRDVLNKLKDSNNVKVLTQDKKLSDVQKNTLLTLESSELNNMLQSADFYRANGKIQPPKEGTYTYMDKDNIIVSIQINHVLGDHAEFLIKK